VPKACCGDKTVSSIQKWGFFNEMDAHMIKIKRLQGEEDWKECGDKRREGKKHKYWDISNIETLLRYLHWILRLSHAI
jgi:hypothetical protein